MSGTNNWTNATRQPIVEFCPDDYQVDIDGYLYVMKLIKCHPSNYEADQNGVRTGIIEPATLPEFTHVYRMAEEHRRMRANAKPFTNETYLETKKEIQEA